MHNAFPKVTLRSPWYAADIDLKSVNNIDNNDNEAVVEIWHIDPN